MKDKNIDSQSESTNFKELKHLKWQAIGFYTNIVIVIITNNDIVTVSLADKR